MIRSYFGGSPGRRRPYVIANVSIPGLAITGTIHFLVDTGADSTVLAPRDAMALGVDLRRLPSGPPSTGIGGRTPTASTAASLTLDALTFDTTLRLLAPTNTQRQALSAIPSLLGRDILAHFALFVEERTDQVLLLLPAEADRLLRYLRRNLGHGQFGEEPPDPEEQRLIEQFIRGYQEQPDVIDPWPEDASPRWRGR